MKKAIISALLTPFENQQINEDALRALVELDIKRGISGFYVCGSTGESFMLTADDRRRIVEIVADQAKGRADIIVQIGSIGTELSIDLGRHALGVQGVTGLSSIPPFYYQFNEGEVLGYYLDLAEALGTPLIPYNFPRLSGVTLTPELIDGMKEKKAISGLKFTSENFYDLGRIKLSHPELTVYNGFDEMYVSGLAMGADGAIGSTFNFMPEKFIRISELFDEGRIEDARRIQGEANQVIEALLGVRCFMAAEKYMLDLIGIPFGDPKRPFLPLDDEEKAFLEKQCLPHLMRE